MRKVMKLVEDVFHGSPHKFDQFSLNHVGSGEGAAAYGWGLYFAGKREVAEYYRDVLVTKKESFAEMKKYLDELEMAVANGGEHLMPTLEHQRRIVADAEKRMRGLLYTAKIPNENLYLLWDAPFDQQPETVQNALMNLLADDAHLYYQPPTGGWLQKIEPEDVTFYKQMQPRMGGVIGTKAEFLRRGNAAGEIFYEYLTQELKTKENASKALLKAGIPGIKYLDQNSRDEGHGSYNYVIFDDSLVSIKSVE